MGVTGDVGWGSVLAFLHIFLSTCLSAHLLYRKLSIFLLVFDSLWRMGVLSPPIKDWGWTVNVPSGNLYRGRKGWNVDNGLGVWRNLSASIYWRKKSVIYFLCLVCVSFMYLCISMETVILMLHFGSQSEWYFYVFWHSKTFFSPKEKANSLNVQTQAVEQQLFPNKIQFKINTVWIGEILI